MMINFNHEQFDFRNFISFSFFDHINQDLYFDKKFIKKHC